MTRMLRNARVTAGGWTSEVAVAVTVTITAGRVCVAMRVSVTADEGD